MTDISLITNNAGKSADTYATAVKIRELLQKLEDQWDPEAAKRALAIVTGDEE